jgi:uncharacterized protein involved in type VI secretion and phage assembly
LLQQINLLLKGSRWQGLSEERQANELFVVRREVKIVPEYQAWIHRPAAYPLRAKVVGPEGEEIYVDAWGRIKVRFMFTRSDDHAHDGGAGANDNDTDSAWVDVLTHGRVRDMAHVFIRVSEKLWSSTSLRGMSIDLCRRTYS